jgi:hypothetical protein
MLEYQLEISEMDKHQLRTPLELKHRAENELGRDIPESIWSDLMEENDVEQTLGDLEQNDHSALEYFLGIVRRYLKYYNAGQKSHLHRPKRNEFEGDLTEYEMGREQALAEYHAKFTSAEWKIRDFRDDVLQGELLSSQEADTFITSVATCFIARGDFRSYGVPYTNYRAMLIEIETNSERGACYQKISCSVEPGSIQLEQPITVCFPVRDRKILDHEMVVQFADKRAISYDYADLSELSLAWAFTIHKSHGSEYPVVFLPVFMQDYLLLSRNLLYTGLTTAQQIAIHIGPLMAIVFAVKRMLDRQRYTELADQLKQARRAFPSRGVLI